MDPVKSLILLSWLLEQWKLSWFFLFEENTSAPPLKSVRLSQAAIRRPACSVQLSVSTNSFRDQRSHLKLVAVLAGARGGLFG